MSGHLPSSLTIDTSPATLRSVSHPVAYSTSYSDNMEFERDTQLPRTDGEWKKALFDIKRDHLNRKHRNCASRCRQLLDAVKSRPHETQIQPAHLIYLHFYAASALEMQAKSLPIASSHRAQLFAQARDHYRRASVLTDAESDTTAKRLSRPCSDSNLSTSSRLSCPPSLLQSPVFTEENGGTSTRTSSPAPSLFSDRDDEASKPRKKHHRKQVSFGDINLVTEPFVRPDSPTLGSDGCLSPTTSVLMSPSSTFPPLDSAAGMRNLLLFAADESDEEEENAPKEEQEGEETKERPSLTYALGQYSATLSSLRRQITAHMSALEAQILPPKVAKTAPMLENEELRRLDLEARIARLRENGFRRPRFDVGRYERLRETALNELGG